MKSNFHFIFFRLAAATVIVGLASLIMVTLFKLLIGALLIGGVVAVASRIAAKNHYMHEHDRFGQFANNSIGPLTHPYKHAHVTVNPDFSQKPVTIIPID